MNKDVKFMINTINSVANKHKSTLLENASDELMQRGIADLIEAQLTKILFAHLPDNAIGSEASSKKSTEDAKIDYNGKEFFIDYKTQDVNAEMSMPNLISAPKLRKLLNDKNKYFVLVMVKYDGHTVININVKLIESIDWASLHIQNIGLGQIQIKNAKNELLDFNGTREEWLNIFSDTVVAFYKKQIIKFDKLIGDWQ